MVIATVMIAAMKCHTTALQVTLIGRQWRRATQINGRLFL